MAICSYASKSSNLWDCVKLTGIVTSGRGMAVHWIPAAREPIASLLGANPFPGTLNLLLQQPAKLDEKRASKFFREGTCFGGPGFSTGNAWSFAGQDVRCMFWK